MDRNPIARARIGAICHRMPRSRHATAQACSLSGRDRVWQMNEIVFERHRHKFCICAQYTKARHHCAFAYVGHARMTGWAIATCLNFKDNAIVRTAWVFNALNREVFVTLMNNSCAKGGILCFVFLRRIAAIATLEQSRAFEKIGTEYWPFASRCPKPSHFQ